MEHVSYAGVTDVATCMEDQPERWPPMRYAVLCSCPEDPTSHVVSTTYIDDHKVTLHLLIAHCPFKSALESWMQVMLSSCEGAWSLSELEKWEKEFVKHHLSTCNLDSELSLHHTPLIALPLFESIRKNHICDHPQTLKSSICWICLYSRSRPRIPTGSLRSGDPPKPDTQSLRALH